MSSGHVAPGLKTQKHDSRQLFSNLKIRKLVTNHAESYNRLKGSIRKREYFVQMKNMQINCGFVHAGARLHLQHTESRYEGRCTNGKTKQNIFDSVIFQTLTDFLETSLRTLRTNARSSSKPLRKVGVGVKKQLLGPPQCRPDDEE